MQAKKIRFFPKKEIEKLEERIRKNYGADISLKGLLVFRTSEDKIWIASKNVAKIDFSKLRINAIGLYIGKIKKGGKFRPSIEFAQVIGRNAKKNVVMVDEEDMEKFIRGSDIEFKKGIRCEERNFVLVKYREYVIGVGRLFDGRVENLVPKSRKIVK